MIGDETTGRAIVVDPRRDITDYLADADRYGLTISKPMSVFSTLALQGGVRCGTPPRVGTVY